MQLFYCAGFQGLDVAAGWSYSLMVAHGGVFTVPWFAIKMFKGGLSRYPLVNVILGNDREMIGKSLDIYYI